MNTTIPAHTISPREKYNRVVGVRTSVYPMALALLCVETTIEDSGALPTEGRAVSLRWVGRKPDAVKLEASSIEVEKSAHPDRSPYREPWSRRLNRWALLIMGWSGVAVIVGTWLWLVGNAVVEAFR